MPASPRPSRPGDRRPSHIEPAMIEEKDRYHAPATLKTARPAAIPAGNHGQKADPADKLTGSLQQFSHPRPNPSAQTSLPSTRQGLSCRLTACLPGPLGRFARPGCWLLASASASRLWPLNAAALPGATPTDAVNAISGLGRDHQPPVGIPARGGRFRVGVLVRTVRPGEVLMRYLRDTLGTGQGKAAGRRRIGPAPHGAAASRAGPAVR
jgi:hypothetical protein